MNDPRQAMVDAMQALVRLGLNRGASGNISVRGDCQARAGLWITPSGIPPAELSAADMVHIDHAGTVTGPWNPSSEWRFHRDVLAARPELRAVVHTHAVHATALAMCGRAIPAAHYMVAAAGGQSVPCAPYATFGSQALSTAIVDTLGATLRACLMANHGMLAAHETLAKAVWLAEEIETLAHQYVLACQVGQPQLLDAAAMQAVHERFAGYGPGARHEEPLS